MIVNSQRTIYGISLQLAQINGIPYEILPNTTLNEKFSIETTTKLKEGTYPAIKYFGIGVGGSDIATGLNTYNFSKHKATDAALFEQIPFVMRTLDNDLLPNEQKKYRFKRNELHNGIEYVCYYLKCIDMDSLIQNFYIVSVKDSIATLSLFDTNTNEFLNPIPRDPAKGMTDLENTKYVACVANIKFSLYKDELAEITNIMNILYGDQNNKGITEIAVCSGVDKLLDTGYNEATSAQIIYHTEVDIDTEAVIKDTGEFVRVIEYGGNEPRV